ncbi:hypothetical protein ABID29_001595 [Streptococcus rupicaprae]|uniref:Uncharacterized protein n=1 Tax=Streptococcus rupicaprae TaxID=759619 RepID=A0ABV2FJ43_9STRE
MSTENISQKLDQTASDLTEAVTPAADLGQQIIKEVNSRSKDNSDSDLVSSEDANR